MKEAELPANCGRRRVARTSVGMLWREESHRLAAGEASVSPIERGPAVVAGREQGTPSLSPLCPSAQLLRVFSVGLDCATVRSHRKPPQRR